MRVKYIITDELQKEVKLALKQERNTVVKERLIAVSLYTSSNMLFRDIATTLDRNADTIGRWIASFFKKGINGLQDNRGGDNKSFLTPSQKEELKHIITNTYPIIYKGWDGKIIVDLIKSRYNVTYTRSGVYELMKRIGITHKIATKVDPKKSEEKISTWKEDIKKNS